MSKKLERELETALLDASKEAVDMLGYYPRNFIEMLTDRGAQQTSEELMTRPKITHGLEVLWEKGRLDLSIEAIVLENPYKELFLEETLKVARKSLKKLGYAVTEYRVLDTGTQDWSDEELEVSIEAYFPMLMKEREGEFYDKSAVIEQLRGSALKSRSKGSIEYRMQNISFVLDEMGIRWIAGYKPARNVGPKVADRIRRIVINRGYVDGDLFESTSVPEEYDERVRKLLKLGLSGTPPSTKTPTKTESVTVTYQRDPHLKAWLLLVANQACELCGKDAPFTRKDGTPGLELHHVVRLADGGLDGIENAVVLCPNCHAACHGSVNCGTLTQELYSHVDRLTRP